MDSFTVVIQTNPMFSELVLRVMRETLEQEGVKVERIHVDNCTMTVHGLSGLNELVQQVATQVRGKTGYQFICSITAGYM